MSLSDLFSLIAILVAVVAIAGPVQRKSLEMFVPLRKDVFPIIIVVAFGIQGANLYLHEENHTTKWCVDTLLFVILLAAIGYWFSNWREAKITENNQDLLPELIRIGLRENKLDEVNRVLFANLQSLHAIPSNFLSSVFEKDVIRDFFNSRSFIHLEILSRVEVLDSIPNVYRPIDLVVRELVLANKSPLKSVVIRKYGGFENFVCEEWERDIVDRTILNPEWYLRTRSDYPLLFIAAENVQSGIFDDDYNRSSIRYAADQGISLRVDCPVYLSIKSQVMAIERGIEEDLDGDYFPDNLMHISRDIRKKSIYSEENWDHADVNTEYPTVYAYLMYQILHHFEDLITQQLRKRNESNVTELTVLSRKLIAMWHACVIDLARTRGHVSQSFVRDAVRSLFDYMLKLHGAPRELLNAHVINDAVINSYENWFTQQFTTNRWCLETPEVTESFNDAFENLDDGRDAVRNGRGWLSEVVY